MKGPTMSKRTKKQNPVLEVVTTIISLPVIAIWSIFD